MESNSQIATSPGEWSPQEVHQLYTDVQLGAIHAPERTIFRVFAPLSRGVDVVLEERPVGDEARSVHPMVPIDKGVWEAVVEGDLAGRFYRFAFTGDLQFPQNEVVDIYAVNTVNSTTNARITPRGTGDPKDWLRFKHAVRCASPVDAVVYEAHVRDLTVSPTSGVDEALRGKYLGWTREGTRLADFPGVATALDHLVELGITHVQLLPVADFDNDESAGAYRWGYVTNAFFSPEGMHATRIDDDSRIRELKALVHALHARGIGVILDVVFNHTGNGATFEDHVPGYYYRSWPDGTPSDGSGCGNDFRSEAPMARRFIIDCLEYWVREFGVDGFRFDLMALVDLETMRQAEIALRRIKPDILIYGEPWAAGDSPIAGYWTDKGALPATIEIGAFNDDFRNALKGSPNGGEPGFIQTGFHRDAVVEGMRGTPSWAPKPSQTLNYLTCHDNLTLWDKLQVSLDGADEERLRAMKLGFFLLMVSQGTPFLHAGSEFARSKRGDHNSYQSPDEINAIDWSLKHQYFELFAFVRDLIAIRKAHPVFRLRSHEEIAARLCFLHHDWHDTIIATIDGRGLPGESWREVCILVNGSPDATATFGLPEGGWRRVCDGRRCIVQSKLWEGEIPVPHRTGMLFHR